MEESDLLFAAIPKILKSAQGLHRPRRSDFKFLNGARDLTLARIWEFWVSDRGVGSLFRCDTQYFKIQTSVKSHAPFGFYVIFEKKSECLSKLTVSM